MADVMRVAAELCVKDSRTEQKRYGQLLPCRKISPLEPFIKLEEYYMLERDTGKYLLYMTAIERATEDILNANPDIKALKCLILGPGLGRLVRFCLEAGRCFEVDVSIHVLEANPVAVEFLRKSFDKEINNKIVYLYEPFTFHPKLRICDLPSALQEHCGSFDIIASELLGCFGDDEFLPELTSILYKLFHKPGSGIMIPDSWTNYLVPVSCPSTYHYLTTNEKSLEAGYTMGLPKDCTFLSNTKAAWTGDCKKLDMKYSCDLDFSLDTKEWTSADALDSKTSVAQSQLQASNGCHGNSKPFKLEGLSDSFCHDNINSVQHEDCPGNSGCYGNSMPLKVEGLSHSGCHDNINSVQHEDCPGNSSCHGNSNSLLSEHSLKYSMNDCEFQSQKNHEINEVANAINNVEKRETDTKYEAGKNTSEILRQMDTYIHGFIGYFTSVLYKDIIIDTRHTSGERNSFHWECYFIPLPKPVLVEPGTHVNLRMDRKCEEYTRDNLSAGLKLWYEWQVLIQPKSEVNSSNVPEYKPKLKKTKFNDEPGSPGLLYQEEHSTPKLSKRLSLEVSSSEEEFDSCKERDEQYSVCKFSVQNQNGESDAVFLTWH